MPMQYILDASCARRPFSSTAEQQEPCGASLVDEGHNWTSAPLMVVPASLSIHVLKEPWSSTADLLQWHQHHAASPQWNSSDIWCQMPDPGVVVAGGNGSELWPAAAARRRGPGLHWQKLRSPCQQQREPTASPGIAGPPKPLPDHCQWRAPGVHH